MMHASGSKASQMPNVPVIAWLCGLFLLYCALGAFGYGNDCDTYLMMSSGRNFWTYGVYEYSRPPSYLIPELLIGGASSLGGFWLSNMISALLATACLYLLWRLLDSVFSARIRMLVVLAVGLNPFVIINASSSMDYFYALFLIMSGIVALRAQRWWLAGVLLGLAISCRLSYILFVVGTFCYFLYWAARESERGALMRVFLSGCLAVVVWWLMYIPAYIAAGHSLAFFSFYETGWSAFGRLTRLAYKNIYLLGLPALLWCVGYAFWRSRRLERLHVTPVVIACLLVALAHEVLFFRLPVEIAYLLPILFALVPLWAYVFEVSARALQVLIVCFLFYGFVGNVDVLTYRASVVAPGLSIHAGKVVDDLRQRGASMDQYFTRYGLKEGTLDVPLLGG